MVHKWREIRRVSALTWILWWGGQLELRQIHALLCLHVGGHFDHQHCIHIAGEDDTAMIMYICVCMYTRFYVCLMWLLYICVAIWSDRLFVLDRMDTGGKGPRAACCLCDSLPPVSALTHVVLAVWTGHLLRFFRISLRILVEKWPLVL